MDRSYVYLRVVGQSNASAVTAALGVEPAKSWSVGDTRSNGTLYNFTHWQTAEFEGEPLDEAVRALVGFIEESRIDLSKLPHGFDATIQCVGYHEDQSPGFHFDADLVRRLGRLGLAIDFDLYCYAKQA